MLINREIKEKLDDIFYVLKLKNKSSVLSLDKEVKIEQILSYLEIVHADIRRTSKKKKLVLIDSGAGNCYLSYLIYYFYQKIDQRNIEIHCVDYNKKLMDNNRALAEKMGFTQMYFYAADINDFTIDKQVDIVYSLHACDTATDKTMYLGVRSNAKIILSVACCQHSLSLKSSALKSVIRYKSFRDKTVMMIADSLRAMLLEKTGYKVDIFDFVSSRYTAKNTMVRAITKGFRKTINLDEEYEKVSAEFRIKPYLEELLADAI